MGATRLAFLALARRPRPFWWGYPLGFFGSRTASETILVGLPAWLFWLSHGVRDHFGGATRLALARLPRGVREHFGGATFGGPKKLENKKINGRGHLLTSNS